MNTKTYSISIPTSEKMSMMISLATMLGSGITLIEAAFSLLEDAKGNQKKILTVIKDDITQGKQLYLSFEKFPSVFDKVTVNIIKASEESGTLDTTLKQIVQNIKKDTEFMDRIKSALYYPFFIMLVFIGMLLMILIVVIPKISTVFLSLRLELPLPTRILIFMSQFILKYTIPTVISFLLLSTIIFIIYKTKKRQLIQTILSLPLIRRLIVKIDLTRFTRNLSTLLKSAVTITSALELTEDIMINKDVKKTIHQCGSMVLAGKRLSDGLKLSKKYIPSIMIRIIESGEKSGTLEKSLEEVADYLDYELSGSLKAITTMMEPVMLVFVGIMIGGMMISIIAPIYGLISQVGGK